MRTQTNPVAVVEDAPLDPTATLEALRTLRRDLKQAVLAPLASWLALPGVLKTADRYSRDVIPAHLGLASLGLTTCVGTDGAGQWVIQIRGNVDGHGIRVSEIGPSLAFTLHQCVERAYERLDRLIAEKEREERRARRAVGA